MALALEALARYKIIRPGLRWPWFYLCRLWNQFYARSPDAEKACIEHVLCTPGISINFHFAPSSIIHVAKEDTILRRLATYIGVCATSGGILAA
jgi:hypothetical protein